MLGNPDGWVQATPKNYATPFEMTDANIDIRHMMDGNFDRLVMNGDAFDKMMGMIDKASDLSKPMPPRGSFSDDAAGAASTDSDSDASLLMTIDEAMDTRGLK